MADVTDVSVLAQQVNDLTESNLKLLQRCAMLETQFNLVCKASHQFVSYDQAKNCGLLDKKEIGTPPKMDQYQEICGVCQHVQKKIPD